MLIEVQRYMEDDILERRKNALQWWRDHDYVYSNLGSLVRQKCCAVTTSVSCERLFSKAGNVVNEKRSRLSANKVQKVLFLNINFKFMQWNCNKLLEDIFYFYSLSIYIILIRKVFLENFLYLFYFNIFIFLTTS